MGEPARSRRSSARLGAARQKAQQAAAPHGLVMQVVRAPKPPARLDRGHAPRGTERRRAPRRAPRVQRRSSLSRLEKATGCIAGLAGDDTAGSSVTRQGSSWLPAAMTAAPIATTAATLWPRLRTT